MSRLPTMRRHKSTSLQSPGYQKFIHQQGYQRGNPPRGFADLISSAENLGMFIKQFTTTKILSILKILIITWKFQTIYQVGHQSITTMATSILTMKIKAKLSRVNTWMPVIPKIPSLKRHCQKEIQMVSTFLWNNIFFINLNKLQNN